jgi:hypothetical protein
MSTAIVTKFELQNQPMTPSISLNDITNKITPERVRHWAPEVAKTLDTLPKATGACVMVVGQEDKIGILVNDMKRDERYRTQIVLREIIAEVRKFKFAYRLGDKPIYTDIQTLWE